MNNKFAPVVCFLYNRPDKTKRMLASLAAARYAKDSELYIYCDGCKQGVDPGPVEEVGRIADEAAQTGSFRNVTVIKSPQNRGLASSVIEGVTEIIKRYGRVIVLEDDLILSEYFLVYMNSCLEHYEDDGRVWSINGHSPDIKFPGSYDKDVYLCFRASSWGWATWKDRWSLADWEVKDYKRLKYDPVFNLRFARGGNDLPSMLRAQMKGRIDSWAVRWCASQSMSNMYSVAPVISLVTNDGLDGSGTNSKHGDHSRYSERMLAEREYDWCPEKLEPDIRVFISFYRKYRIGFFIRIRDKFRQIVSAR